MTYYTDYYLTAYYTKPLIIKTAPIFDNNTNINTMTEIKLTDDYTIKLSTYTTNAIRHLLSTVELQLQEGNEGPGSTCYACGEEGHITVHCPKRQLKHY